MLFWHTHFFKVNVAFELDMSEQNGAVVVMVLMFLQMFDWISHNKEVFLQSHTEIGRSYQHAVELQTQHNHFAMNSMVANVTTIIPILQHQNCTDQNDSEVYYMSKNESKHLRL